MDAELEFEINKFREEGFITSEEAVDLVKKSIATVRRFCQENNNNKKIIQQLKNTRGRKLYLIKKDALIHHFNNYKSENQQNWSKQESAENFSSNREGDTKSEYQGTSQEKIALIAISKNSQEITNKTQQQFDQVLNKPFYQKPVFWVSSGFIVLIVFLIIVGGLYRNEMIDNQLNKISDINFSYKGKITDIKREYENELVFKNSQFISLKNRLTEKEKYFNTIIATKDTLSTYQEEQLKNYETQVSELKQKIYKLTHNKDSDSKMLVSTDQKKVPKESQNKI
jgi:hypothetical protein